MVEHLLDYLKSCEMKVYSYKYEVGSLMYDMVTTRPDLSSVVNMASRFMSGIDTSHSNAIQRIMLQSTLASQTWS